MTGRLLYIQMLRALAANAVLLYHISFVEKKYADIPRTFEKVYEIGAFGYDIFFVISGLIMYMLTRNISSGEFLFDRVTRIYPPYWFYTSLIIPIFIFYPSVLNASFSATPELWRTYLLFPDITHPLLIVGWTLVLEMYFYLAFALALASRVRVEWAVAAWGAVVIGGAAAFGASITEAPQPVLHTILNPLTLEFIAGVLIGSLIQSGRVKYASWVMVAALGWMVAVVAIIPNAHAMDGALRVALVLPAASMIVYGLAVLDVRARSAPPRWLVRLGDASYSIYLCQIFVISAIGRVYFRFPAPDWVPPDIVRVALVLTCLMVPNIVGLVSYRWLERPTMRLARQLRPQYLRIVASVVRRKPRAA